MPGIVPDEGEVLTANLVLKGGDANRGTDLELGLFINTSVSELTVLADIVEPTGGLYTRKTLTDANWSMTGGIAVYPKQTFTPVATAYGQLIYGYFIATKGTAPKLLLIEVDPLGPYIIDTTSLYDITPRIQVA